MVEDRLRDAKAQGLGARLGADVPLVRNRLLLRVEGNYERYAWTFAPADGDTFRAQGATDLVWGVTTSLGATY